MPFYSYEFLDQTAPDYFPPMPGFVTLAYHTGDIQYLFPLYKGGAVGIAHALNKQQRFSLISWWLLGRTSCGQAIQTGRATNLGRVIRRPIFTWFTENLAVPPPVVATTYSPPITIPPTTPAGLSTETNAQFSAEHQCAFWDTVLQYGP